MAENVLPLIDNVLVSGPVTKICLNGSAINIQSLRVFCTKLLNVLKIVFQRCTTDEFSLVSSAADIKTVSSKVWVPEAVANTVLRPASVTTSISIVSVESTNDKALSILRFTLPISFEVENSYSGR